jgi:hypothetical protein
LPRGFWRLFGPFFIQSFRLRFLNPIKLCASIVKTHFIYGPQSLPIGGEFDQGLGGGAEEDIEQDLFVAEHQWEHLVWDCENHMEVVCGKNRLQSLLKPLGAFKPLAFGAVAIPARVVRDTGEPTSVFACVHMSAEIGSAASLDISHRLELLRR